MPKIVSDNGEWEYTITSVWKRTIDYPTVPCPSCGGSGEVGGGFKSFDGPEACWRCGGGGKIADVASAEPCPEHPKELVDALKRVYNEFIERQTQYKVR